MNSRGYGNSAYASERYIHKEYFCRHHRTVLDVGAVKGRVMHNMPRCTVVHVPIFTSPKVTGDYTRHAVVSK